ncbi:MAG: inositol monophosphatase [Pseudomonadota bacterium]|nr:inositol monophosphatase [Pseudomonadota bacterium]
MLELLTDLQRAARIAEQAAYAAGTHLQASRARLTEVMVTQQAPGDVVAAIKREVRTLIRDVVARAFPDHGFAGGPPDHAFDPDLPCWVVTPLDGTLNYLRGYPQYAVSIALVEDGRPRIGVIYDPCRNEFFGAIAGQGAVLNGVRITCAKGRPAQESLAATVFPRPASPRMPVYMSELGRVLRAYGGVRRSGSMALELACVAAGRLDAFWQHDLDPLDASAGIVLLQETGALLHARDGLPLLRSHSVLACTPPLFESFLGLLADG